MRLRSYFLNKTFEPSICLRGFMVKGNTSRQGPFHLHVDSSLPDVSCIVHMLIVTIGDFVLWVVIGLLWYLMSVLLVHLVLLFCHLLQV